MIPVHYVTDIVEDIIKNLEGNFTLGKSSELLPKCLEILCKVEAIIDPEDNHNQTTGLMLKERYITRLCELSWPQDAIETLVGVFRGMVIDTKLLKDVIEKINQ